MFADKRGGGKFLPSFLIMLVIGTLFGYRLFFYTRQDTCFAPPTDSPTSEVESAQMVSAYHSERPVSSQGPSAPEFKPVVWSPKDALYTFEPFSTQELQKVLDQLYGKGPSFPNPIPGIAPKQLPSGLDHVSTTKRKSIFVKSILPIILFENKRLLHF